MKTILVWSIVIGLVWLAAVGSTTALLALQVPDGNGAVRALNASLINWGPGLGGFIAGPLTLAIVLHVLLNVADRVGFKVSGVTLQDFSFGANVQSLIAVIIIVGFVIAALAGMGAVGPLKDLALVVVGFYFGQRKRSNELEDAAATGAATALAVGAATPDATSDRPVASPSP